MDWKEKGRKEAGRPVRRMLLWPRRGAVMEEKG